MHCYDLFHRNRSAEKERERRIAHAHSQGGGAQGPHQQIQGRSAKDPTGKGNKKRKKDKKKESQTMMEQIDINKVCGRICFCSLSTVPLKAMPSNRLRLTSCFQLNCSYTYLSDHTEFR